MEPIITIVGLVAAGWVAWKTGWAIRTLRAQRRDSDGRGDRGGYASGSAAGIGGFGAGSSSGDSGFGGHGHGGGDCGGHGHGGGDGGGHGGW